MPSQRDRRVRFFATSFVPDDFQEQKRRHHVKQQHQQFPGKVVDEKIVHREGATVHLSLARNQLQSLSAVCVA